MACIKSVIIFERHLFTGYYTPFDLPYSVWSLIFRKQVLTPISAMLMGLKITFAENQ